MGVNVISDYPGLKNVILAFDETGNVVNNQNNTGATTGSILILGTATDGPVGQPIKVNDNNIAMFGTGLNKAGYQDGSTLVKSYKVAKQIGCNDIRLLRITGSNAKCSIVAQSTSEQQRKRVEEVYVNGGNAKCDFILSKDNIVADSVSVSCDGVELITGVSYDAPTKKVSIDEGVISAGKNIIVSYNYNRVEIVKDTFKVNPKDTTMFPASEDNAVFKLTYTDNKASNVATDKSKIVVTINGTPFTDFNVIRKEVSGTDPKEYNEIVTIKKTLLKKDDKVICKYKALTDTKYTADENSNSSGPFITPATYHDKTFDKDVIVDSIQIYCNGRLSKNQDFEYSTDTKKLSISSTVGELGDEIKLTYVYIDSTTVENTLNFESYFGGNVYNLGSVEVKDITNKDSDVLGKKIILTVPESKIINNIKSYEFTSLEYPTLGQLIDAVNNSGNGVYRAYSEGYDISTKTLTSGTYYFGYGEDGIRCSSDEIYSSLAGEKDLDGYCSDEYPGTYTLIRDYMVDHIVLTGIYADSITLDREHDFANDLCLHTLGLTLKGCYCRGYIDYSPCRNTSLSGVQRYAAELAKKTDNVYFAKKDGVVVENNGVRIDIGKGLSTFAGPYFKFVDDTLGVIEAQPCLVAAALDSVIPVQSNIDSKPVPGCVGLTYDIGLTSLELLTSKHINCAHRVTEKDEADSFEFESGYTCAYVEKNPDGSINKNKSSDFNSISTTDVVRYTIDAIRKVVKPFRSEGGFDSAKHNACSAQIEKKLTELKEKGIILNSGFILTASDSATDKNKVDLMIELSLKIAKEIKDITFVVSVS